MHAGEVTNKENSSPFWGVEQWLEGILGSDMRFIYGVAVPMVAVVDLLVLLTIKPSWFIVAVLMVVELACLVLVVYGLMMILAEGEDEEPDHF